MNLGGKSLKVNSRKTLAIALTVVLAMATLGALLALAPAKAQGTITLSSANLHPYKVIEITVNLPGVDVTDIDLRVTDSTGQPLTLTYKEAFTPTFTGQLKAVRLATGVYVAYLGGHNVDLSTNPAYPKKAIAGSIAKVPTLSSGSTIIVEALGYGISITVTYDTVKPASISFDRTEVPARRTGEYTVRLSVVDQDLNLDPTKVDDLSTYPIKVDVTWISGTTGRTDTKSLTLSGATIKESAVNSGSFTASFTVSGITPSGVTLAKGDTFLLSVASNIGWGADDTKTVTGKLTVVYRYPEVSVSFTQQGITISITSPDDNVGTVAEDTLDPTKSVTIAFAGKTYGIAGSSFTETGKNTGVFTYTLPVEWGSTSDLSTAPLKVILGLDKKSFTLSATYLDITGSGTYATASPEVTVVKASPVNVILLVKDKDINVDKNSIDSLTAEVDATNDIIKLKKDALVIYEVSFKKPDGTLVDIPATYPPAGTSINFFETDFDTGEFRFVIPSTGLFEAGKSYTVAIKDHTGDYAVSVPITISPVKIELDRSAYPVNRDSDVVVYITYVDDRYNANPAVIEYIPADVVKYKVVNPVTGETVIPETSISGDVLKETGPDTGVFAGKITISANIPKYIDAKITVYTAEDVKAEAVFKVYQLTPGDLKVEPASINVTGCFKITVYDPDANVDSKNVDQVKVVVKGVEKWAKETDVNTGIFTITVYAKELAVSPGTTITVKYTEKTPSLSPTATTFAGSEYDITATVKVVSFTGFLVVPKDWIGPYEIMKVKVKDPDLNVDPEKVDGPVAVKVTIEGKVETYSVNLYETDVNTGEFSGKLSVAYLVTGSYTPSPDQIAGLIGKRVTLVYLDEADATGAKATQIAVLTVKAFDAEVTTDKAAVNLGESFKIIVSNPDIAENPAVDFRKVIVRSTTYPAGVTLYASEVKPGVYEVTVTAVSLKDWVMGAPQIPAKLGDTITIEYMDPIAADGKSKLFAKTIVVGVPVERPVPASEQKFLDVTGAEKKVGKVGETVMLSAKVQNVDVVDREFTAVFQVKDENGAVVYIAWITAKLAPGTSMTPAVSWTPTVAGTYTVEVLVVKSIAEPTPYSDKISAPFTVQ